MQAYAHDVAAEGVSTAGVELQSRGMSMSFLSQQVCSLIKSCCITIVTMAGVCIKCLAQAAFLSTLAEHRLVHTPTLGESIELVTGEGQLQVSALTPDSVHISAWDHT